MGLYYETGNGWILTKLARKELMLDAYLCCPGPSLAQVDPNKLKGKGRMVFAINTAYPYIKPDVWMGLDDISCYDRNLLFEPFMKIFRGKYYETMTYEGFPVKNFPNTFWASFKVPEKGKTMFNYRNHDSNFVWHKNTLAGMIHYIIWLGIKNIHLLGCDMGGNKDYYDDRILTDYQRKYNRRLYGNQIYFIKNLAEDGSKHGVTFISCTPNSPLNQFLNFLPVEEALAKTESKTEIQSNEIVHALDSQKVTVVTVYKSGGDYTTDYVYRLQESIKKYLPKSKFVCLSDVEIKDVETIQLKHDVPGYWNKIELFEHFKEGKTLSIDLSVVIQKDLSPLISYSGFRMVKDFINPKYFNSCVMTWEGDHSYIAEKFFANTRKYINDYQVDWNAPWKSGLEQKFVEDTAKDPKPFNDGLIVSYKLASDEMKKKSIIIKWHGRPKPHEVKWDAYYPVPKKVKRKRMRWEVLAELINNEKLKSVVELGIGKSQTFGYLLTHCPNAVIIGVDQWKKLPERKVPGAETYESWDMELLKTRAHDLVNQHPTKAIVFDMTTTEAVKHVKDESIDLLFIDADHTYEGVMNDIQNWLPKVKEGGYIYGHDIDWLSVIYGVTHFFENYNKAEDNLWWIRKTKN